MKKQHNKSQDWNERYLTENTPWRHETAHYKLIELIEKYTAEKASILEIGCGTGIEAITLTKLGYDVLAIDIAEKAIELATAEAKREKSRAKFQMLNFMENHQQLGKFSTIFDVACMHTFATNKLRMQFVDHIAQHLESNAIWINLSCAKPAIEVVEQETGVEAPPGLTLIDLAKATAEHFNLLEIASMSIPVKRENKAITEFPTWISVFQKMDI